MKKNKQVRLCIDPKRTINPSLVTDHYLIPKIDDLLMKFANKTVFSLIDLKGAYQQLMIKQDCQRLLTMNTPFGLFLYSRMLFGIKPAPAIFQKIIERILKDLDCGIYLDDVVVASGTIEQHKKSLNEIFARLASYNVIINWEKTELFQSQLQYLGHVITADGIGPNVDKIKLILAAPKPTNVKEMLTFTGMTGYYGKFIPRLYEAMAPLSELVKKDVPFNWMSEHDKAFNIVKEQIKNYQLLAHFDEKKDIALAVDASDKGICGVLLHVVDDIEKPIFYFSRKLTETEKRYPIIHREALAIVYGLEKCFAYIFGKKITVITDHRPLLGIFNKDLPPIIAHRLQRYLIRAAIFDFILVYRKGKFNWLADYGSRNPVDDTMSEEDAKEEERAKICTIIAEDELSMLNMKLATDEDAFLSKLRDFIMNGFPEPLSKAWKMWLELFINRLIY